MGDEGAASGELDQRQGIFCHCMSFAMKAIPEIGRDVCCDDRIHQVVGYIGYTQDHLPRMSCSPPALRKLVAIPAILAARIARSSFVTRRWLK